MDLDDFRYYTEWHDHVNRREYEAVADPWKPVHVDPNEVERFTVFSLVWGLGRIRGGDWDRSENCTRVSEMAMHEGLRQRFEEGRDWEETAYYEWAKDRLDERDTFRGCEDIEEFREGRCAGLDDLFERMRTQGYRPNYEAVYDSPADIEYVHEMEPLVAIGRDGEILWTEGFHRLILARILDVEAIPVYVVRRHAEWQEIRDRLHATAGSELPAELEAYADHPDAQDVLD